MMMKPFLLLMCLCFLWIEVAKVASSVMLLRMVAPVVTEPSEDPSLRRRRLQSSTYTLRVTAVRLILAESNRAVLTINNGAVIDVAHYMTVNFNLRALTRVAVGSVRWTVTSHDNASNGTTNGSYEYVDSVSPYSLCPSTSDDVYPACSILANPGVYTVTATTYSGPEASGIPGPSSQVTFEMVNSCKTPTFLDPNWTNYNPNYPIRVIEPMGLLVGDDMVLFGGFYNGIANVTNHTYARSMSNASSTWRRMDDIPLPGGLTHAAEVTIGSKVYLCGGYSVYPGPHRTSCYVYDHAAAAGSQWSTLADLPIGSAGAGLIHDAASHTLFYAGGRQSYNFSNPGTLDVTYTWKYALQNASSAVGWVPSTPIPYAANHQSAVTHTDAMGKQRHFYMGGQERLYECCRNKNEVYEFVVATETWVRRADMPLARGHATASTRALGCGFFIAGGSVNSPIGILNRTTDMSYYDIVADRWTRMGDVPFPGATPVVVVPPNSGYIHFVNQRPNSSRRRIAV